MGSREEALAKLREGEFENARNIFSEILDGDPTNQDLISGYFTSAYWDNRLDVILHLKEGRERGVKLVKMFDEYESELLKRNLPKSSAYDSITHCILSEASYHFQLAYRNEGINGLDKEILQNLSLCLIRTGDYKNALDIIDYSHNFKENTVLNLYYKAECLFHLGDPVKSKIIYREAFLLNPELLRFDIVKSEPMSRAIKELGKRFKTDDELREYLPIYCLEKRYLDELKDYSRDEILGFYYEIERLEKNLINTSDLMSFKITCRILQYGITILDSFHSQINAELTKRVTDKIHKIDPGLLARRVLKKEK